MTDRRDRVLAHLDTANGHGLEIGPLYTPIATKDKMDVVYVDVHLAEGLRDYYAAHPGLPIEDIVDVDYALINDGVTRSLAEATAGAAPFDWVIASHVIEHVPDMIGWLRDVADTLVDGGRLALAVPDRRYTFDARRPPTTVGEMLLAELNKDTRPSVRAIFDHYSGAVTITPVEAWTDGPPGPDARIHPMAYSREMLEKSTKDEVYVDSHVWLFTPSEFVEQLSTLAELGLLDFTVHSLTPTAVYDMEFFVTLARVPRGLDEAGRRALFADGFTVPVDNVKPGSEPESEPVASDAFDVKLVPLSAKEKRLIDAKRSAIIRARGAFRRARLR